MLRTISMDVTSARSKLPCRKHCSFGRQDRTKRGGIYINESDEDPETSIKLRTPSKILSLKFPSYPFLDISYRKACRPTSPQRHPPRTSLVNGSSAPLKHLLIIPLGRTRRRHGSTCRHL